MNQRFQIEDLLTQNNAGVSYRALDSTTDQPVELHRLFPFGPKGGGLRRDEQTIYNQTIEQLVRIHHPALRHVIAGGCDPVDELPYFATEWLPGTALESFLQHRHLNATEAKRLITDALDISQKVSQALSDEAVWLETDLHTLRISDEDTGRGITFSIAPLRHLSKTDAERSLQTIVKLTERVTGWEGKSLTNPKGLEAWLVWLREHAKTATLQEASEKLANINTAQPSSPAKALTPQAARPAPSPQVTAKKKKSKKKDHTVVAFFGTFLAVGLGIGGMKMIQAKPKESNSLSIAESPSLPTEPIQKPQEKPADAVIPPVSPPLTFLSKPAPSNSETPEQRASRQAIELTAAAKQTSDLNDAKAAALAEAIAQRKGVFSPTDHELLLAQNRQQVTVEGIFQAIDYSSSRKTMYLLFSQDPNTVRGKIRVKGAADDLSDAKISPLSGKKISIKGEVQIEKIAGIMRPVVVIESREAIQCHE